MVASPAGFKGKNASPSNPPVVRKRSLFSGIAKPLFSIVILLPHLRAYASISVIHRPNESLLHLAALSSSLSVSAISRGGGGGGPGKVGGSASFGGRTGISAGSTSNQRSHARSTLLLANESNTADAIVRTVGENETSGGSDTTPAPSSVSDTTPATASLSASSSSSNEPSTALDKPPKKTMSRWKEAMDSSPRAKACVLMATAMSLHFGGYEFARSAALALFTSSETGFTHPSAYPFAIGLVTPLTLSLLYWYGVTLKSSGPRKALRKTTSVVLAMLLAGDGLVAALSSTAFAWSPGSIAWLTRAVVGMLFVFQNSYAHLIYTQQWSFLGSVMTPTEGTRWFTFIAGYCSLVCTLTASSVQTIANRTGGLVLLIFMTCATLWLSMLCADRAYELSSEHGFDPSRELQERQSKKDGEKKSLDETSDGEESLLAKTGRMFRTSPTLAGLFGEVIAFQSLSTILNVCFVRQLKLCIPVDGERAAFTGQFYAGVNGVSGLTQFFVLPLLRKYLEPQWVYRFLPLVLMPLFTYAAVVPTSAGGSKLWIASVAFFALKSTDYSIRNIANELVYQPLDFDARYLGKEVIGVFANRFGKSGTSMILSVLSGFGLLTKGTRSMSQLAVAVGALWSACSVTLSNYVVTNRQAEERVRQRSSTRKEQPDIASAEEEKAAPNSASRGNRGEPESRSTPSHAEELSQDANQTTDGEREEEEATEVFTEAKPATIAAPRTEETSSAIDENHASGPERNSATVKMKEE